MSLPPQWTWAIGPPPSLPTPPLSSSTHTNPIYSRDPLRGAKLCSVRVPRIPYKTLDQTRCPRGIKRVSSPAGTHAPRNPARVPHEHSQAHGCTHAHPLHSLNYFCPSIPFFLLKLNLNDLLTAFPGPSSHNPLISLPLSVQIPTVSVAHPPGSRLGKVRLEGGGG